MRQRGVLLCCLLVGRARALWMARPHRPRTLPLLTPRLTTTVCRSAIDADRSRYRWGSSAGSAVFRAAMSAWSADTRARTQGDICPSRAIHLCLSYCQEEAPHSE